MREPLPAGQELRSLTLANGGVLEYIVDTSAPSDLPLLVYHHGTPAAGPISPDLLNAARACGFRLVELVRPGYGGSRQPGRSIADNARLTEVLVAHLGVDRFASCGWSGGGPHTLADVALVLGCVGAVSIAGVAPYGLPDLDFLDGMGQDNLDEFAAALDPEQLQAFLSAAQGELAHVTNETMRTAMASLLPAADLAHLASSGHDLAASLRWSIADGIWGWFDDDRAFVSPWGFDLSAISKPVVVLQGSEDLMVPFAHGRWLAQAIPTAHAVLVPGEGHLSVVASHLEAALQHLRAALG